MQLGTPGPEDMPDARIDSDRVESRKTARISQNICQIMPENMSDRMPENMSDRMSENMSDRMPENVR